jgi:hypothetical protein
VAYEFSKLIPFSFAHYCGLYLLTSQAAAQVASIEAGGDGTVVQKTEQQLLQAALAAEKRKQRGRRQLPEDAARQEMFPYNGESPCSMQQTVTM